MKTLIPHQYPTKEQIKDIELGELPALGCTCNPFDLYTCPICKHFAATLEYLGVSLTSGNSIEDRKKRRK